MKTDNRYKKRFKQIADSMGFLDKTQHVVYDDPINKKQRYMLINNHKRFVEGMLALPVKEQAARLAKFEELQSQLEADVQAGKLDFNSLLREAQSSEVPVEAKEESSEINLGSEE